jgi:hypothetical protein
MDMKCNHKKIIAQHKNVAHMANNGGKGKERDNKKNTHKVLQFLHHKA